MFYGRERVNMGKRILSIILAGIILMLPMQYVSAEEPDFIIEEGVLSQYNGTLKNVVIPEGVTSIGNSAFSGNISIESIIFPDSVLSIGQYAFSNCKSLKNIQWPEGLQNIAQYAFRGCEALTDLYLPGTLETIGLCAFAGCNNLKNVYVPADFPDTENILAYGPFSYCDANFKATFEEGTTRIPSGLFIESAISEVVFPDTVTTIGKRAFLGCENLTSVKLPVQLNVIEDQAFNNCYNLSSVWIPKSLQNIEHSFGWGPFWGCENLKEIAFEEGITEILPYLLAETAIEELIVPASVTKIGNNAFAECDELINLHIPESVTEIGEKIVNNSENATIICVNNSAAHKYAVQYGIPYILDEEHTHSFGEWIIDEEATYESEGKRHRQCIGCGEIESEIIPKLQPDLEAYPDYTYATFHIVDAVTEENIAGALITLQDGIENYEFQTGEDGTVKVFLPGGEYDIQVEKEGYLLRGFRYTLEAGELSVPKIAISKKPVAQGDLTVTEMTQEEIIDAGIDINAPDNQHVYKYQVTLTFNDGLEIPIVSLKNSSGNEIKFSIGKSSNEKYETEDHEGNKLTITRINEYMYMVVQGSTKWQKEMFHIQMLILNTSMIDDLVDCKAILNLPDGLSLADMKYEEQTEVQDIGTISKGKVKSAEWYVRGDKTGEYDVSSVLEGKFSTFGDEFSYEYQTSEPLYVYAGTDMKLTIHLSDAAYYEEPYTMIFELENVSDRPIYNITHEVNRMSQYQVSEYTWIKKGQVVDYEKDWDTLSVQGIGSSGKVEKDVFLPGEKLAILVKSVVIWQSPLERLKETAEGTKTLLKLAGYMTGIPMTGAGMDMLFSIISAMDVRYYLNSAVASQLEGSTTAIPTYFDIEHQKGIRLQDKLFKEQIEKLYSFGKGEIIKWAVGDAGAEAIDIGTSLFKGMQTEIELKADTECIAWVESADGSSDVISVSAEGAEKHEYGQLILKGTTDISVTALNAGEATLFIRDEDGNLLQKTFRVKEKFPGQETVLGDVGDIVELENIILGPQTFLTEPLEEFLGIAGLNISFEGEKLKPGDIISTGAMIQDEKRGENIAIVVPGDTNSDSKIDLFDSFKILDSAGGKAELTESQKIAGDYNADTEIDKSDAEYLLNYLTNTEINSRDTMETKYNTEINFGTLVQGEENIRGIQVDIPDLKKSSIDSVSVDTSIAGDFSKAVYNSQGDYIRVIAAAYEGFLEDDNASVSIQYNNQGKEIILPAKVYIQTEEETVVKDIEIKFSGDAENIAFQDVHENDWYYDPVQYVSKNKLMTGLNETTFGPIDSLARAQFAVILHRMNGEPEVPYSARFHDVGEGLWYTNAILWAADTQVVTGYSNGNFGTGDKINREQMALMMFRYANYKGYDTSARADFSSYQDASMVSDFAAEAIGKYNETQLDPKGNASRAECATIIMRFVEKYGK